MRSNSNFTAYFLIFVGVYFLLSKFNLIPNLIPLFIDWWPVLLILAGVSMLFKRTS